MLPNQVTPIHKGGSILPMVYCIIEDFLPSSGENWNRYCRWRAIKFTHFYSIDSILRPSLFEPKTDEDWQYIGNDVSSHHYITDFDYALKTYQKLGIGSLVGISFEEHNETNSGFLGYDIIDGNNDISLLTNWGNDIEIINQHLTSKALISTYDTVSHIHHYLLNKHTDDPHVVGSRIASIYSTQHLQAKL